MNSDESQILPLKFSKTRLKLKKFKEIKKNSHLNLSIAWKYFEAFFDLSKLSQRSLLRVHFKEVQL